MDINWQELLVPLWLTLKVAFYTTILLLIFGSIFAMWLSRSQSFYKPFIEALVALPLVLPSTVLGFYLLILLEPNGWLGSLLDYLELPSLIFSFYGLILASFLYSLPFAVQPLIHGFEQLGKRPSEVAATLGASPLDSFFSVLLPLSRRYYLMAATLSFAHTMGEFGVILMIGGNIPGVTQVASIAIYNYVESMDYAQAHILSFIMLLISFLILSAIYIINQRMEIKITK